MKSLVVKDLYNLAGSVKPVLFALIFMSLINIKQGPMSTIIMGSIFGAMLIMTSFTLDSATKWNRYAMTMPIKKDDMVKSKFVLLSLISICAVSVSTLIGIVMSTLIGKVNLVNIEEIMLIAGGCFIGVVLSLMMGGVSIPLILKYGVDKARILSIVAFVVPFFSIIGLIKFLEVTNFNINLSIEVIVLLITTAIIVWIFGMYKWSCSIVSKKEF